MRIYKRTQHIREHTYIDTQIEMQMIMKTKRVNIQTNGMNIKARRSVRTLDACIYAIYAIGKAASNSNDM